MIGLGSSMTSRIVTSTYRYKPPPKRKGRKLAKITGPAVVTQKNGRRLGETAAEAGEIQPAPAGTRTGRRQSTTARASGGDHIPANDDRKSAIVLASGVLAAVLTKVVGVIWKGWDGLPG